MQKLYFAAYTLWRDARGQDMIEYSLMASAVVIATAGFFPTTIVPAISNIFSSINSSMARVP
ncbi:MAG: Flp family type IVb pilin [Bryobacteraceae bacterium]